MSTFFSGFHHHSLADRRGLLFEWIKQRDIQSKNSPIARPNDSMNLAERVLDSGGLTLEHANRMIENTIGLFALPLGVATNFVINGKQYAVPMVTEEPSVIAAANAAAKLVATGCENGFSTTASGNIMTAQIQMLDLDDPDATVDAISASQEDLIVAANQACQNMVKRGGGVKNIEAYVLQPRMIKFAPKATNIATHTKPTVVVNLHVDVQNAMGANAVNTIAESLAPILENKFGGRTGLKILTNLCSQRTASAAFSIPLSKLAWKGVEGQCVAERIIEAYQFALADVQRAVTNNKGIMNGIDAVAIATGQDWRAIEASAHGYAATACGDQYGPLAHYWIEEDAGNNLRENMLHGYLEIPISVGTVGGSVTSQDVCAFSMHLLDMPDAQQLAQIIVSVGLAQNFAALRALAIEGIQKGHMALHARKVETGNISMQK